MKILALSYSEADVTLDDMGPHLAAEAQAAWDTYLNGCLREAYLCGSAAGPVAALILEAESTTHVHVLLDSFPLRRAGLVRFEVVELGPFVPWTMLLPAAPPSSPGV